MRAISPAKLNIFRTLLAVKAVGQVSRYSPKTTETVIVTSVGTPLRRPGV
jgi:hypothetical protein